MKRFGLLLAVLAFCGCAALKVGLDERGVVVESEAATPREAERQSVAGLLDLFVSSSTRATSSRLMDEKILSHAQAYVGRRKVLPSVAEKTKLRVLILAGKLLKDLNDLALIKPGGIFGSPKILVSFKETGPGAGKDVGRASDVLRRQLTARGYEVQDLSDHLNERRQKTGSEEEALAAARVTGADVMVFGVVSATAAPNDSSASYRISHARLSAGVHAVATGGSIASLEEEADAEDLSSQEAASKALEDVGQQAAEKLADALAKSFPRSSEMSLEVLGLENLAVVRRFIFAVRQLPRVTGAAVLELSPGLTRLQVFTDGLTVEDMGALLLRLPDHILEVHAVDTDARVIEVACGGRK